MIKEVTDINFIDEVVGEDMVVVADFWATWCGPCKMLSPVLQEVAGEMGKKVKFVKINVDENPTLAQKFRISTIPTLMVLHKGEVKDMMVGFRPKGDIVKLVEKHL